MLADVAAARYQACGEDVPAALWNRRIYLAGFPVPPLRERARDWCWHLHGALTHLLRYRFLGDMILCRIAPAGMRRAAWVDGFNLALGSGHQGWLLSLLNEHEDGNEDGWEVRLSLDAQDAIMPQRHEAAADTALLLGVIEDEDGRWWV